MENKELKIIYNEKIKRYYNGCQYIKEHIKEADKWLPEVFKILAADPASGILTVLLLPITAGNSLVSSA